jgi:hypothetical protein
MNGSVLQKLLYGPFDISKPEAHSKWLVCRSLHGFLTIATNIVAQHQLRAQNKSERRVFLLAISIKQHDVIELLRHTRPSEFAGTSATPTLLEKLCLQVLWIEVGSFPHKSVTLVQLAVRTRP